MRHRISGGIAHGASALVLCGIVASTLAASAQQPRRLDPTGPLTPELAAQLAQNVTHHMIVIMNNPLAGGTAGGDRAAVMSELTQTGATRLKSYQLVNSFAATVSEDHVTRLKANPAVAMVVPDAVMRRPRVSPNRGTGLTPSGPSSAPNATPSGPSLTPNVIPGACGANGAVLLEPEALQVTNTDFTDPSALTARSLGFTGAGVKVAWIADGVDPNNVNFIRSNNTSAFIDYQDFSGDGPGQPTGGEEAFLDSNAIAGQGIHVYDVSNFSAQPDSPCNIRIEGIAPGASMVGLDVFGSFEDTLTSNFLQAIDYAVNTDHVDVLNESFGSNNYPDTSQDAVKLFNDAAVQAGVTVTVSSGDGGPFNTIGSPASDPNVISVGASTTFRFYAQTNYAAARYFATTGWLNDNNSALSSSGFNETGRVIDLVAPGDLGWASCDASPLFSGCVNFKGQSSNVEDSGGTSLSSPLTAGAAALVIQAYRQTHQGASPSPALVKQILTSAATDLGLPASEQGAGLLNTYKAVLLAQNIGPALLFSVNQLNAVANPGTAQQWPVTVTNVGTVNQNVEVSGWNFGPDQNVQSGSVTLTDGTSPTFTNWGGITDNYAVFNFNVGSGAARLQAAIAYPGQSGAGDQRVRLILIDPNGRFAAHSLPQGIGNYGSVDVREPVPGMWTGVIFGLVEASGGLNGTIPWQVSTQQSVHFGTVSPSSFSLAAGQSRQITVRASTPPKPGDTAGSIVFTSSAGGVDSVVGPESNSIPVTLRSLINTSRGGAFSGVVTGGNGRGSYGQAAYYQFEVGKGVTSVTANVSLTNDFGLDVGSYLVSPNGVALGFGQNNQLSGTNTQSLTAYALDPVPGLWTLIVDFATPVVGNEVAQTFSGSIELNRVRVSASGLPNNKSTKLAAGTPITVPVKITNNGAAPGAFFVDARLNNNVSLALTSIAQSTGLSLPLTGSMPIWLVPTHTSSIQVTAVASLPVEFDYGPIQGDPDLYSSSGTTATGTYTPSGGLVQQGVWFAAPGEIGPYPAGAPAGTVSVAMVASTLQFDPAFASTTGDIWPNPLTNSFSPLIINPGQTGVINITITPSGPSGTVVQGFLYVDTFVDALPPYGQDTGDELAVLPYTYTIK
jgi:Subtilase family/Peptidase inhibitor I9